MESLASSPGTAMVRRPGAALMRLREAVARAWESIASSAGRGPGFWLTTLLLGVVLPAPVAVVVVAARLRRAGLGWPRRAPRG